MNIARSISGEERVGGRLGVVWRVAIVFAMAVLIGVAVTQGATAVFGDGYSRAGHVTRAFAFLLGYVSLVVVARRYLDRRPLEGIGLGPLRSTARPLLLGVTAWLIPGAIGIALCLALGWTTVTPTEPLGPILALIALRLVLVLVYEALPEELLFRGYLYHNLATVVPRWLAVIVQAVLFTLWGAALGAAGSVDRILLFLVFSLVLGVIRVSTGSVWTTIGFHWAFQTVAQVLSPVETAFSITDLQTLQMVSGVLPFVLGILIVKRAHRAAPGWREREPDEIPAAATHP